MTTFDAREIKSLFHEVLAYAKANDYAGYSKFDALNSPILEKISRRSALLRLIFIQAVNRFPFHIRPLLGVRTSRNPKGIALFARALLSAHATFGNDGYGEEAKRLLKWLEENNSNRDGQYSGYCWGYNFIWQSPGFYAPRYMPNCVVTVFAGEAFVQAYRMLGNDRYLSVARNAADFILKDLPILEDDGNVKCIGYVPAEVGFKVININALSAAFLIKIWKETGEDFLRDEAEKLIKFVVSKRTDYYAWYYTDPPDDSPISHDNYHTGGILDAILEFMEETGEDGLRDIYVNGLQYYKENLFSPEGAPYFMNNKKWPYDIHGSAQGIISFCKAFSYLKEPSFWDYANRILAWTLTNLYSGKGYFYYQKYPFYTKRFTLMRWCNAWMLRGIATYLRNFI